MNPTIDPDATLVRAPQELPGSPEFPGYTIQRLLGEGGMAQVYLALDQNLNRPVAIKVMSSALADNTDFQERFEEEAKIIARFRHPHVVTVHASGIIGVDRYIVQEFIPGGTLEDLLAKGALPAAKTLRVAGEIASALAYSHAHDIIHRDVKPANILFSEENAAVLSDFGIAKSLVTSESRTVAGSVVGSIQYMAPEQLLGQPPTDKVDVYALGLVMCEMLLGRLLSQEFRVIPADDHAAKLRRHLGEVDRATAHLIGLCLRPTPEERPTAHDLAEMLVARQSASTNRKTHRSTITIGLAATVLIASSAVGAILWRSSHPELLVNPANASVFVNGTLHSDSVRLDDGELLELAVTAPGYLGRLLKLDGTATEDITAGLTTWQQPDLEQLTSFSQAFHKDASVEQLADLVFRHPVYQQAIELNRLHVAGSMEELARRALDLRKLAEAGDAPSQLIVFLAADEGLIELDSKISVNYLKSASQTGYGLATFYVGLNARRQEETLRSGTDPLALRQLAETMDRAAEQGLEFAVEFAEDARRAITDSR